MKINNRHFAAMIILAIAGLCHYGVYFTWFLAPPEWFGSLGNTYAVAFSHFGAAVFWVFTVIGMSSDAINFEMTVPVPFASLRATYRAKTELNRAIESKCIAMANATGSDFERLDNERVALEKALAEL